MMGRGVLQAQGAKWPCRAIGIEGVLQSRSMERRKPGGIDRGLKGIVHRKYGRAYTWIGEIQEVQRVLATPQRWSTPCSSPYDASLDKRWHRGRHPTSPRSYEFGQYPQKRNLDRLNRTAPYYGPHTGAGYYLDLHPGSIKRFYPDRLPRRELSQSRHHFTRPHRSSHGLRDDHSDPGHHESRHRTYRIGPSRTQVEPFHYSVDGRSYTRPHSDHFSSQHHDRRYPRLHSAHHHQ